MAREHESQREHDDQASGSEAAGEARSRGERIVGGAEGWAHEAVRFTGSVAGDGVHLVRDVATDAVHAVGDVGSEVVRTASSLLVGLVQGLRGVADSMGRRPPTQPPAA